MGVCGVVCQLRKFGGWERGSVHTAMVEAARARRERNLVEGMLKAVVGTVVVLVVVRWFWMLMMVRRTEETERAAVTFLYSRSSPCSDGLKCQLLVGLQAPSFHSVLPAS